MFDRYKHLVEFTSGETLVERFQSLNDMVDGVVKPFSPSDLAAVGLLEYTITCSEREKALITAWLSLEECHRQLHISFKTLKEKPTDRHKEQVKRCYEALVLLGMTHLLCDDKLYKRFMKC